tara:strand:+ start:69 stop:341 length:273 start_codon:yes stop_codon:yes gene_type:complete
LYLHFFALKRVVIFIPQVFQVGDKGLTMVKIRTLLTGHLIKENIIIIHNGIPDFLVIFQVLIFITDIGTLLMEIQTMEIQRHIHLAGRVI